LKDKILVIGASGQIGSELVIELRNYYGSSNVIAADIKIPIYDVMESGPFELLDVLNRKQLRKVLEKHSINQVYLLAALLSATAEQHPEAAWKLNIDGLLNLLSLCKSNNIAKVFWPSTIAVFGPGTPKDNTPQNTIMDPNTVYGISKLAGERWCEYFFVKDGIDIRSVRYPGLIGHKSSPGGGTTDYAVHIYHEALKHGKYICFLKKDTTLPMMYMPDALNATINVMEADSKKISVRSSYNIAGFSISPKELADEIKNHLPGFKCTYKPDKRQNLTRGWPKSIDDSIARKDWNWKPTYDLQLMTVDMLDNLQYHNPVISNKKKK